MREILNPLIVSGSGIQGIILSVIKFFINIGIII